jgi:hypothetical protein
MADGLDQVKYDVAVANRVLAEIGLATGVLASLGHASLRVPSHGRTCSRSSTPIRATSWR